MNLMEQIMPDLSREVLRINMSGDKPSIIITRDDKRLCLEDLDGMSGEDFVQSCKLVIEEKPVYMWKGEIFSFSGFSEKSTGTYGLAYSWNAGGSAPLEGSRTLITQNALDCLREIRNHTLCVYD